MRPAGPGWCRYYCFVAVLFCASWRWLALTSQAMQSTAAGHRPATPPPPPAPPASPAPAGPQPGTGEPTGQLTFYDPRGFHRAPSQPVTHPTTNLSRWEAERSARLPPDTYLPPLPPAYREAAQPCHGLAQRPVGPPQPLPPSPRYLLLVDAWQEGQLALRVFEHVIEMCRQFRLVLVLPFVRDTYIGGMPGWMQWKAHELHSYLGFAAARGLKPISSYIDVPYTRQFVPTVEFEEFCRLSNHTISTAVQVDWMSRNCEIPPEWFPAHGARVQATQFLCIKPHRFLTAMDIDVWLAPRHPRMQQAEGRASTVPSFALLNWRIADNGLNPPRDSCRLRAAPQWNETAVEFCRRYFPPRYLALRIKGGVLLQSVVVGPCFQRIARALEYYRGRLGYTKEMPIFLSTDWPVLPEGRWNYPGMAAITGQFNALYRRFNLQQYRNRALDPGEEALVQLYALANAAVVVGLDDLVLQQVHLYAPHTPLVVLGDLASCRFEPPAPTAPAA